MTYNPSSSTGGGQGKRRYYGVLGVDRVLDGEELLPFIIVARTMASAQNLWDQSNFSKGEKVRPLSESESEEIITSDKLIFFSDKTWDEVKKSIPPLTPAMKIQADAYNLVEARRKELEKDE